MKVRRRACAAAKPSACSTYRHLKKVSRSRSVAVRSSSDVVAGPDSARSSVQALSSMWSPFRHVLRPPRATPAVHGPRLPAAPGRCAGLSPPHRGEAGAAAPGSAREVGPFYATLVTGTLRPRPSAVTVTSQPPGDDSTERRPPPPEDQPHLPPGVCPRDRKS